MLDNHDRSNSDQTPLELLREKRARLERRGEQRHIALLRVALLHVEDSKELCVVRNISPSGLSARVYRKVVGGEQVHVEFRSGELLSGSVVWERDWEVGIVFLAPINVDSVLASRWVTENGQRRVLPRVKVGSRGRLKVGSRSFGVVLQDISQGGARVQSNSPITDTGDVVLTLPGLPPIGGVIRWVGGTEIGVSFNECLPFERLGQWIEARRNEGELPTTNSKPR